jgi:recombination protein RecA
MGKRKIEEVELKPGMSFADLVIADINTKFKSNVPVASYLHDPDALTHVKDWISSGCDMLDLAISNRHFGGYPSGKIIEIIGLEGSGKSLLAVGALVSTQRKGGIAVLIDTESAATEQFFEALGLDTKKLIYLQLEALEDIYAAVERIIETARKSGKDVPVTIVIDSIMGASTKSELEATYDRQGYATGKALINSIAMRKITNLIAKERILLIGTNQLRANVGGFGNAEQWVTSGGKAWAFHASVRLRLKVMGQINGKTEQGFESIVGRKVRVQVIKNRLGPPLRSVDFEIYFNSGIDNYGSWIRMLESLKALKKEGHSWVYTYVDTDTGEEKSVKFKEEKFAQILDKDPDLKTHIYNSICDAYIMDYLPNDGTMEYTEIGLDEMIGEDD